MAVRRSSRAIASLLLTLSGVGLFLALSATRGMTQGLAWAPSTPDGEPQLDYKRRVLKCNDGGCQLTVVRSLEELLQAMSGSVTLSGAPGSEKLLQAPSSTSEGLQPQPTRISIGMILILGSCYGGELPWRVGGEELRVTIPPEVEERMKSAASRIQTYQKPVNRRTNLELVTPIAATVNVR